MIDFVIDALTGVAGGLFVFVIIAFIFWLVLGDDQ